MKGSNLTIRPVSEAEQKNWDNLALHPLQTWAWGKFRLRMGIDTVKLGVFDEHKLIEAWQLTFHKIPHSPLTIGYFPKGPPLSETMIDELTKLGWQKNAILIQLEPNVVQLPTCNLQLAANVKPSHHPLFTKYTFVLDLFKSEEELLAAMHSKTRYNIKVAQKHNVIVKENNSDQAFASYLKLAKETTNRQGFFAHNDLYHRKMWKTMHEARIAKLFTASFNDEILSAWIVFIWKDTLYYPYGTSSRNHREVMAPNLMLWEITKWAKKQGLKYFDLWGALGPDPDPNDPWFGFHRFKEGYNPQHIEFIGSYDLIIHPFQYRLYTIADTIRWKYLKFIK